jgi:hypothetical protein
MLKAFTESRRWVKGHVMTERSWFSMLVSLFLLAAGCGPEGANDRRAAGGGDAETTELAMSQSGVISRGEVAARAEDWISRGIRYDWDEKTDGYRRDCAGYVSRSLGIPASDQGGPNTVGLRDHVDPIDRSQLKLGDVIGKIGPGTELDKGHVLLFKRWVDSNTYEAYEMHGPTGTVVGVYRHEYPYDEYAGFAAYRYNKISECAGYVTQSGVCCDGTCKPGCAC